MVTKPPLSVARMQPPQAIESHVLVLFGTAIAAIYIVQRLVLTIGYLVLAHPFALLVAAVVFPLVAPLVLCILFCMALLVPLVTSLVVVVGSAVATTLLFSWVWRKVQAVMAIARAELAASSDIVLNAMDDFAAWWDPSDKLGLSFLHPW